MNVECPNCHALHFLAKKLINSHNTNPMFGVCYLQGKVNLPPPPLFPQELRDLYTDPSDQLSFRANIHQYNSAFALTSLGVNIDRETVQG